MDGQKVVKVFCHEEEAKAGFNAAQRRALSRAPTTPTAIANILMPCHGNLGNLIYVLVALVGGAALLAPNGSIAGLTVGTLVVPFLHADQAASTSPSARSPSSSTPSSWRWPARSASLTCMDEAPEAGRRLCHPGQRARGRRRHPAPKAPERTGALGVEASPHGDGTVTYTRAEGRRRYGSTSTSATSDDKTVLHDITLYAKPGPEDRLRRRRPARARRPSPT